METKKLNFDDLQKIEGGSDPSFIASFKLIFITIFGKPILW